MQEFTEEELVSLDRACGDRHQAMNRSYGKHRESHFVTNQIREERKHIDSARRKIRLLLRAE